MAIVNFSDERHATPILITGMHRSGTTLIAQLLRKCGYFCGDDLDGNSESKFFLHINEWLLRRANGAWDSPESFRFVTGVPEIRSQAVTRLKKLLKSPWGLRYFGPRNLLAKGSILKGAWGLKDPRLVYTMPLWNEVFSGRIRLIYVQRNGIDVARSLQARQEKIVSRNLIRSYEKTALYKKLGYSLFPVDKHIMQSPRCCSIDEAFSLWERYVLEGEAMFNSFKGDKMRIVYEDFLADGERSLGDAALFCGLRVRDDQLLDAVQSIDSRRSYAFFSDEKLRSYYESKRKNHSMKLAGYADINPR